MSDDRLIDMLDSYEGKTEWRYIASVQWGTDEGVARKDFTNTFDHAVGRMGCYPTYEAEEWARKQGMGKSCDIMRGYRIVYYDE